jgi:hypothetical protein
VLIICVEGIAMVPSDSSAASSFQFPTWQREYNAVLAERDPAGLFKCVEVAEAAILSRRENLRRSENHQDERKLLEAALSQVLLIKKDWLKFA